MAQLPTRRYGAYLRKMAIDGYIIYTDTTEIKAFTDMDEIRERLDEIWQLQRRILSSQR